jgi:hypothetical protein
VYNIKGIFCKYLISKIGKSSLFFYNWGVHYYPIFLLAGPFFEQKWRPWVWLGFFLVHPNHLNNNRCKMTSKNYLQFFSYLFIYKSCFSIEFLFINFIWWFSFLGFFGIKSCSCTTPVSLCPNQCGLDWFEMIMIKFEVYFWDGLIIHIWF